MTTKTISSTYPSGYLLKSGVTVLEVTSTGQIDGFSGPATNYEYGGIGVKGGIALDAPVAVSAYNSGVIRGGNGGASGYVGSGLGIAGGAGGVAAYFAAGGYLGNLNVITGGAGGTGGTGYFLQAPGGAGGAGVYFKALGTVSNIGGITGGTGGVGAFGGTGGTIIAPGAAGGAGVELAGGGSLSNSGSIVGGVGGIGSRNGRETAIAAGGTGGAGVVLNGAGSVTNNGVIAGGAGGFGSPIGSSGDGVVMLGGGQITNGHSGLNSADIAGAVGVDAGARGAVTVINYGTIQGTTGDSVFFGAAGRLVAEAGSSFIGAIAGGGGSLELAGGTGDISGLGGTETLSGGVRGTFSNFGSYTIDAGAAWTLTGAGDLSATQTIFVTGSLTNNGGISVAGATIPGGAGSTVLLATGAAGVFNAAGLDGGKGANGVDSSPGNGGAGGAGAAAVSFSSTGTLTNTAEISGGVGGAGGVGASNGGNGGAGGSGVTATGSAKVTNNATIFGGDGGAGGNGVSLFGGSGGGGGTGMVLGAGATVTNSGEIVGGAGGHGGGFGVGGAGGFGGEGVSASGASTVINYDLIQGGAGGAAGVAEGEPAQGGDGADGINLLNGGGVDNFSTILGGAGGVGQNGGPNGGEGFGVVLNNGGAVTNGGPGVSAALIEGYVGVDAYSTLAVTVTNYGTLEGNSAVVFHGSTNDRLIAEGGSSLIGSVYGGGGTLELATGKGTIGALGAVIADFGTYQIDAGGSWTLNGANTVGAGQSLTNSGTLNVGVGSYLHMVGGMTNSGAIVLDGAGLGAYAGLILSGNQTLSGGGTVNLNANGYIAGLAAGDSLTNLDNTITGAGIIKGPLVLTNESAGVIDASTGTMGINLGDTLINDGLIESIGTGTLFVRFTTIDSSGGGSIVDGKVLVLDTSTLEGGALTVDTGATLRAGTGAGVVNLGAATVSSAGIIEGTAGGLTIDGVVSNNHVIESFNGDLTITGAVTGSGLARLFGSGALEVDGAFSQRVTFAAGSTATLILGDTAGFTGAILGLSKAGANHIYLKNLAFDPNAVATYKANKANPASGGTLTIADGSTVLATLHLAGSDYTGQTFTLSNDGGGTLITDPPKTAALTSAMASFGAGGASSSLAGAPTKPVATPASGLAYRLTKGAHT